MKSADGLSFSFNCTKLTSRALAVADYPEKVIL